MSKHKRLSPNQLEKTPGQKRRLKAPCLQHPQGVQPWAMCLVRGGSSCRDSGLGLLGSLPDELIANILGSLPAATLCRIKAVSKAFYCFSTHDEVWRSLTLRVWPEDGLDELQAHIWYRGSWQQTYLAHAFPGIQLPEDKLRVQDMYSDLLYQSWRCASAPLRKGWLSAQTIPRAYGLSAEEFQSQFEAANRPVIITDGASDWPALHKWTRTHLQASYGSKSTVVGDMDMPLANYIQYMDHNTDDMPLYLFDKGFTRAAPALGSDFQVPACFAEDLLAVLGPERPDHRWLIWGPARSGSTFHKDPNATSAWNAVVRGRKRWILYPPNTQPPGVHASEDGANVATPVSLMEWFLNFWDQAMEGPVQPLQGTVGPGEVIFVPSGWWHMAINLEETVAITQNYCSSANLAKVLRFLEAGSADLVSGCAQTDRSSLHARFMQALQTQQPEVLEALQLRQKQTLQQPLNAAIVASAKPFTFSFFGNA